MYSDPRLRIELTVAADQPNLLVGLENLRELGLISDSDLRRLARQQLTCELPALTKPGIAAQIAASTTTLTVDPKSLSAVPDALEADVSADSRSASRLAATVNADENRLMTGLQAWSAELSVRWLLLVGVFLVVVSSAVLAASQWQYFPPVGQYGILLAYTLAFCVASLWTRKHATLRLTSQMLALTTLLIIPINFWVMDAFGLFRSGAGWMVAIAASIGLTVMGYRLLKPFLDSQSSRFLCYVGLILPWLQLGWNLLGVPLIAPYIGTILTTVVLLWIDQKSPLMPSDIAVEESQSDLTSDSAAPRPPSYLLWVTLLGGVLLLLGRAILVRQVPLAQMGLAVALCGWLMAWLDRRSHHPLWKTIGITLLLAGRLQVTSAATPWQALVMSGLALVLFWDWVSVSRTNDGDHPRSRQSLALIALWITHIQVLWPLWRLVPESLQTWLVTVPTQWVGTAGMPVALLGVVLFPDLGLHLQVAKIFRQRHQNRLARNAERLAFIFWLGLTFLSLANPGLRSLNLTLSALTLIVYSRRSQASTVLLPYALQFLTVSAIASWITTLFPTLSQPFWAGVLLVGCLIEWLLAGWAFRSAPWQKSAWLSGLILSSCSYVLILAKLPLPDWSWLWYAIPVVATLLALKTNFPHARAAAVYSTIFLVITPFISYEQLVPRIGGMVLATGLAGLNSRRIPNLLMAAIAVGFGVVSVWTGLFSLGNRLTLALFLNAPFVLNGLLWILRDWFNRQSTPWHQLYRKVLGGWAMTLHHLHLSFLTLMILVGYIFQSTGGWDTGWKSGLAIAGVLGSLVMAYRIWQVPGNWGFWLLAWSLQLFTLTMTLILRRSPEAGGFLEFGLAFLALFAGYLWTKRTQQPYLSSWHWIPIVFAVIARLIQLHEWTAFSGLGTITVAAVSLIVGQRAPHLRWLTYPSVGLVTLGLYDLLTYQLQQFPSSQAGDHLVILGLLAALLAIVYRLLTTQLITRLSLPRDGGLVIAHAHWGLGQALLLSALSSGLTISGEWALVGVTLLLASYALGQGRQVPAWIYIGAAEGYLAIAGVCSLVFPSDQLQMWGAAIAAIVAGITCVIPWSRWGWQANPWQQMACILPGLALFLTLDQVTILSLLAVAGFYVGFAQLKAAIRWSYLSVLITDWVILRLLHRYHGSGTLASLFLAAASLLYVAEVDPVLSQNPSKRERHLLRLFAIAILSIAALQESDGQFVWGLLVAALGLSLAGVGIYRRTRAFLYGGTALFVLKVFRQLWLFIADYSLLLWAIGIALGMLLIWIAATFEARRAETLALLRHWQAELADWD